MTSRRAVAGSLVSIALVSACGKPSFTSPDRADPAVRQEEDRLATLLAASRGHGLLDSAERASCRVRLLRKVGSTDYAWATCTGASGAADVPVRVVGQDVTVAADGDDTGAANSLDRIFPRDMAKAIEADESRYKP
ncbi:MAG: hypothetical protein ACXVGH_03735 [Mycobacteriales bacterium]